jgi:phage shock protein E
VKNLIIMGAVLLGIYIIYRSYYMLNLDGGLEHRIREGAVILDVRTQGEWNRGHIDGAVNIPLSKLHDGPIPIAKDGVIITCCSHGLRSVKALSELKRRGYQNVYNGGSWNDLQEIVLRTRPR